MRTSRFYYAFVFSLKFFECCDKFFNRGEELILNRDNRRNVHSGGECVVRRLTHIYVVVGVAEFCAGKLICTVCNNLVCVHIGLCARTCLPNNERKMSVKFARNNLVARFFDNVQLFSRHFFGFKLGICHCRRFFEYSECVCDFARHCFNVYADFKVFVASLCLCRPKTVGRNFHFTHRVVFNTVFHFKFPPFLYVKIIDYFF